MSDGQMPEEPKPADEFMSLTHIGWDWQISNRVLSQELEDEGYKRFGKPTQKALNEGLAVCDGRHYRWSRDKVGQFIFRCGCSGRSKPLTNKLVACKWIVL